MIDTDEDFELTKIPLLAKFLLIIMVFVGGFFIGVSAAHPATTEEQVAYFENRLNELDTIHPFFNENNTIGYATGMYFRYGSVSQGLLMQEIRNVCGPCGIGNKVSLPVMNQSLKEEVLVLCQQLESS